MCADSSSIHRLILILGEERQNIARAAFTHIARARRIKYDRFTYLRLGKLCAATDRPVAAGSKSPDAGTSPPKLTRDLCDDAACCRLISDLQTVTVDIMRTEPEKQVMNYFFSSASCSCSSLVEIR